MAQISVYAYDTNVGKILWFRSGNTGPRVLLDLEHPASPRLISLRRVTWYQCEEPVTASPDDEPLSGLVVEPYPELALPIHAHTVNKYVPAAATRDTLLAIRGEEFIVCGTVPAHLKQHGHASWVIRSSHLGVRWVPFSPSRLQDTIDYQWKDKTETFAYDWLFDYSGRKLLKWRTTEGELVTV